MRWQMRSKIHKATLTQSDLDYVGSITIDTNLIEAVGLWPGEKVLVVSNTSGARLETYVIEGERGAGDICVNGAAAHLIGAGEDIIIMGFELSAERVHPRVILPSPDNREFRYIVEEPKTVSEPF